MTLFTLPHAEMTAMATPLPKQMAGFTFCHSAWDFLHGRNSCVVLPTEAPTKKHCQPEDQACPGPSSEAPQKADLTFSLKEAPLLGCKRTMERTRF